MIIIVVFSQKKKGKKTFNDLLKQKINQTNYIYLY